MASVTSTYARAFADVVFHQRIDAGKALTEVRAIAQLVAASKPLREVWEAPSIPAEQKRGLLDAIVARERISRPVRNFIAVVIDHRRIKFLQSIVQQLERELNQRMGFTEAQITSARELSEPERRALETQVEKLTSKKVRARYAQDRSILGIAGPDLLAGQFLNLRFEGPPLRFTQLSRAGNLCFGEAHSLIQFPFKLLDDRLQKLDAAMIDHHSYKVPHRPGNSLARDNGVQQASLLLRRNRWRLPNFAQWFACRHKLGNCSHFSQRLPGVNPLMKNDVREGTGVSAGYRCHALLPTLAGFRTRSIRGCRKLIGKIAH